MLTSGLVITLSSDAQRADEAQAAMGARPEFTLGERNQRWLPVVFEAVDVAASHDLHAWLNALPGVEFVDVVQVNFEEDETAVEVCENIRPHPGPLLQERENRSPSVASACDGTGEAGPCKGEAEHQANPFPGGEDRGEGERPTSLKEHHYQLREVTL